MTYIPDCREDEDYNFENLREEDQGFIRGYDFCVERAADNFFDNLDVDFGVDSYIGHFLNEELPEDMQSAYIWENSDGETEERQVNTVADYLRSKMLDWLEMARDEIIVGIIDGYVTDDE